MRRCSGRLGTIVGKGIDMARPEAPEHAAVLDDFKDQLLIALLNRLADARGRVTVPVLEVDMTGLLVVSFSVNDGDFNFTVSQKQ